MRGCTRTGDEDGMTIGLFVSVWGASVVMPRASRFGWTIGPPAARLYAVDPVGVAMMSPSPLTRVRNSSPTETERSINRERAVLVITTSLSARWVANGAA